MGIWNGELVSPETNRYKVKTFITYWTGDVIGTYDFAWEMTQEAVDAGLSYYPEVGDFILFNESSSPETQGVWVIDSLVGSVATMSRRADFQLGSEVKYGEEIYIERTKTRLYAHMYDDNNPMVNSIQIGQAGTYLEWYSYSFFMGLSFAPSFMNYLHLYDSQNKEFIVSFENMMKTFEGWSNNATDNIGKVLTVVDNTPFGVKFRWQLPT